MAIEDKEIGHLIGSDKVEGTAVYGADGERIGSVERVMLDKRSGQVSYAVLAFGGFLGIGDDHYPLSWDSLKYNTDLGGYQVAVTEDDLTSAPRYTHEEEWDWNDPARARSVDDYYGGAFGFVQNSSPDARRERI
ncbi:photosystem reaction center subunit H [Labrys miyagiensis]